ncbi:cobyrinic acid a,c-diamide synthase [Suicoccus acidiformans]|uniref:Cobyrinate a,c-diamide synthase n=1 Tax=Suicoccus acidiformans TaxID=2036206 RepID=A0A347WM21_9LACT|nr:cobyrinate a,c-diamide synthase [Suicoccus acidiformans]AXY26128.1 cobyrinic acid a,c-diamide synthase [Suicoccus acidiformans]
MKEFLIAGVTSGVGKTTISLGLMQALINRGLIVQPYKVGPDYVDTAFHTKITQRSSVNLDQFMLQDIEVLRALYARALVGTDIAMVEGVMGLYDGYGLDKLYCSSAGIAVHLDLPVVLVVDGAATSTSAAAIVKGFVDLEPRLNVIGVILNRVNSTSHFELLKRAIEHYTNITVFGYVPKNEAYHLSSRKLGLVPENEITNLLEQVQILAEVLEDTVDINMLLDCSEVAREHRSWQSILAKFQPDESEEVHFNLDAPYRLAYAKDPAFQFYYQDNFSLLKDWGVELIPFSPLNDSALPEAEAFYFGGGYPELHAEALASNQSMRQSVLYAHQSGAPIYGETGGLMYLGQTLETEVGVHPMVGVFPGVSYQTPRLRRFGYCEMTLKEDTVLGMKGDILRGHEFHYSDFDTTLPTVADFQKIRDGKCLKDWTGGYQVRRSFASYMYLHFYQNRNIIRHLIRAMSDYRRSK